MTALAALTEREVLGQLRDDVPFAILAPAGFFIVFHFALRNVIDTGETSYAQYLLPVIIVQVTLLGALATVDRAAVNQQSEIGVRLRTLPISAATPLIARMLYCLLRGSIALMTAVAIGYLFGFRIVGGFGYAIAFVVLVLVFTLALSLGADAAGAGIAGSEIARSGTSSQVLLVPQLLLIMLSSGMAPVESFPDWLHPFVRYQPVSQVTETLRGLATGHVNGPNLEGTLLWCGGLLVLFGALAVRIQRRAV
ncbi:MULTISPECIES: ABC transporter permease [Mycobacteriaceae]|uniref:ABC transporter permease n=1 Tax=Mycobacteriaceae TaxID=1762 RepID=UPI0008006786|nr:MULTISPECIES: ABC transporter permease [Mycobacteriaceae]MCK0173977.1 ABC transporter permease [Mycolicibacterium sp. F2034L]OBB55757.1 ABC transporter [Mycobacterium sp. 852013-51886_SCH5428379]